jgi:mitogen-activated protein kinase kinase kinase 7
MAPELFSDNVQLQQSTKVDVYSFGIIMYELFFETIPYRENEEQFASIVGLGTRVVGGLRPTLANFSQNGLSEAENLYLELMQECWSGDPEERPSFDQIFTKFMDIKSLL